MSLEQRLDLQKHLGQRVKHRKQLRRVHASGHRRVRVTYVRLSPSGMQLGLEPYDPLALPHVPFDGSDGAEEAEEMGAEVPAAWISDWAALELELRKRNRFGELKWAPSVDFVNAGVVVGVSGSF